MQPRSLDFVQPGVGFLPSFHLDGVSLLHRIAPPGESMRGKIFLFTFDQNCSPVQEVREYRVELIVQSRIQSIAQRREYNAVSST